VAFGSLEVAFAKNVISSPTNADVGLALNVTSVDRIVEVLTVHSGDFAESTEKRVDEDARIEDRNRRQTTRIAAFNARHWLKIPRWLPAFSCTREYKYCPPVARPIVDDVGSDQRSETRNNVTLYKNS
jgi:hypothetical protein